MGKIHTQAMQPLVNLMESNLEYHQLQCMEKKGYSVPKFRHEALETKFCEHLETMCEYFRDYGELKEFFNTRRMVNLLKRDGWKNVPPFKFYLQPLEDAMTTMRTRLL